MKKLVGGSVLIFIGLFMLLGVFSGDTLAKGSLASNIILIVVFIIAPIGIGGLLVRNHFTTKRHALQDQRKTLQEQREKQVIRLAQKKGGRLTIPEIVVDTSMSTEEAEAMMQTMTSKGYVDMQVTDSGVIVYEFYEIAHRNSLDE